MESRAVTQPRFWPLATLILLPVVVLTAASVYGLIQRGKAVRTEAAALCRIEPVDSAWGDVLSAAIEASPRVVLYSDPPRPRVLEEGPRDGLLDLDDPVTPTAKQLAEGEHRLEKALAEKDLAGLRSLMEETDHAPWFTASGLPVPALAAWHWLQIRREARNADPRPGGPPPDIPAADVQLAVRVLTIEAPSALTPLLLEKWAPLFPEAAAAGHAVWALMEVRRDALRRISPPRHRRQGGLYGPPQIVPLPHADPAITGVPAGEEAARVLSDSWEGRERPRTFALVMPRSAGDERVLLESELRSAVRALEEKAVPLLPPWACVEVTVKPENFLRFGTRLLPIRLGTEAGFTLTTSESSLWTLRAGARDRRHIYKDYDRLVLWAAGFILTSLVTATLGLWLVRRTLNKERRLGELKSQFVSSVSHELRAPVGSLRLMAEGLASGKVSGAAADEFHRLMAGEGARLSSLIENVLDFARIEQGRKEYHMAETDLAALVQDAVKLMSPHAEARGLRIDSECEALPFVPHLDAGAVQQALINLLDNAIKFTPVAGTSSPHDSPHAEGGQDVSATVLVRLAADPSRNSWSLAVTDHGPGIPREEHARIFERFYRLGNELRRESTGTGIGLAIVKHIVQSHGGRVEVESKTGSGSVFRMIFPARSRQ